MMCFQPNLEGSKETIRALGCQGAVPTIPEKPWHPPSPGFSRVARLSTAPSVNGYSEAATVCPDLHRSESVHSRVCRARHRCRLCDKSHLGPEMKTQRQPWQPLSNLFVDAPFGVYAVDAELRLAYANIKAKEALQACPAMTCVSVRPLPRGS